MLRKGADRILPPRGPVPPIRMGGRGLAARSRVETALRLFLRVAAVIWIVEGIHQWLGVLTGPDTTYLPAASPAHVAGLFFFCILDFVAAVGLWLVASWGVAVWLTTMAGHLLALLLAPASLADPVLLLGGDALLLAAYSALAWAAARERRRS